MVEQQEEQPQMTAGQIRQKRILSEISMLKHLNKDLFRIEQSNDALTGFSIHVTISKKAIPSEMKKESIEEYEFEIQMSNKYPFRDPAVLCHTTFTHPMLCITDGRDLFNEVVGEGGWKVGHKLYSLIQLIPEFIQEMYLIEDDLYTIGQFHLGQIYDLAHFVNQEHDMTIWACQEQIDENGQEFQVRNIAVSPSAILLFQPFADNAQYGILIAWASLQSIARLRKNSASQDFLSIIFKPMEERQPWVLNLVIPQHEECTQKIVQNLTSLGVNNKKQKVKSQHVDKPRIALHEVTKEAIMEMDINELLANIQAYEVEISAAEDSLTISTVQTLITLYQKAIEYYSAMDNELYKDVRNRMQSLLARPDVEALMQSQQESTNAASNASSTDQSASGAEEQKTTTTTASTVTVKQEMFKIDDEDEDDEEALEENKQLEKPPVEEEKNEAKAEEQAKTDE